MASYSAVKRILIVVGLVMGCMTAFYGGRAARNCLGPGVSAAYAADPEPVPEVGAERVWVDDEEQGILELGEEEILRIQTAAGGLTGYERAMIVAKRLNDALAAGAAASDVAAQQVADQWVVTIGDSSLITANSEEAGQAGCTPAELAEQWANEITIALLTAPPVPAGEEEVGEAALEEPAAEIEEATEEPTEGSEAAAEWQPQEPYKDKIVPIISVLEGVRIGIARVNGPESAVNQVQAVAQLETHYKNTLEIDVYVPISTKVPGKTLARVQGVGVTGLGDVRL